MKTRFLIVGNWKMNPVSGEDAESLLHSLSNLTRQLLHVTSLVCVPHLYLRELVAKSRSYVNYHVGAQDAVPGETASQTGSISMEMIKQSGTDHVLIGHSERRAAGDTDLIINEKLKDALAREMFPVLIVGEDERGKTKSYLNTIKKQLDMALDKISKKDISSVIFAYEPVWAVGNKAVRECSTEECKEVVEMIREYLDERGVKNAGQEATIIYGGSTDDKNIRSYLEEGGVDGVLSGRASLDPRVIGLMLKIAEDVAIKKLQAANL